MMWEHRGKYKLCHRNSFKLLQKRKHLRCKEKEKIADINQKNNSCLGILRV